MRAGTSLTKLVVWTTVVACSAPLLSLVILSSAAQWPFPDLWPRVTSVSHVTRLLLLPRLQEAVWTSVVIAVLTTALTIVAVFHAARATALYNFWGKDLLKLMVLLPIMIPPATITMGLHFAMIRVHLAGTLLGVVLVHTLFAVPYAFRILLNVFELVGERHEEQAAMLGADTLTVWRTVTVPLVMPGLIAAATMSFIISFSQFITTFMIGGGRYLTLPLLLVPHVQGGELQIAATYSLVFIVAAILALILMQKLVRNFYREAFFLNP